MITSETKIPLKWFAILLVCWVVTTVYGTVNDKAHIERMDAFMAAGDRFTGKQGRAHEARILKLEQEVEKLTNERK